MLAVTVTAGGGWFAWQHHTGAGETEPPIPPAQFFTDQWSTAIGGDEAPDASDWKALEDFSTSGLGADAAKVADLARKVVTSDLTGQGRTAFAGYWPDPATAGKPCTDLTVLASSPAKLPATDGQDRAKVLVAVKGTCDPVWLDTSGGYAAVYVYATSTDDGWQPVREWTLPGSTTTTADGTAAALDEWDLSSLGTCGDPGNAAFKARILAAEAWKVMCADAAKAKVTLKVTDAYRTPAQQGALFDEAIRFYGSEAEARRHVAFTQGQTCTSKHCAGLAIDVTAGAGLTWLNQTVGCATTSGVTLGASSCPAGAHPVARMQRYGFAVTAAANPDHLEFTLPVTDDASTVASDCSPESDNVPAVVAAVFRCRLQTAGLAPDVVRQTTAEALVVSRCESGWNPAVKAFGGRYTTQKHPSYGRTYTEHGLFMLPAGLDGWIPGGKDAASSAVAGANAAASVWLAQRGWALFGCATGDGVGAGTGPVLPAYGGPALPTWTSQY
jgi:hypothetical protein